MSATPRPSASRTSSAQSTASSRGRGLQRLLSRVKTALKRGNPNSRNISQTPSNNVDAASYRLSAPTISESARQQLVESLAARPTSSPTNAATATSDEIPPMRPNIETPPLSVHHPNIPHIDPSTSNFNLETLLTVDDEENDIPDSIDESIIPLAYSGRSPSGIAEAKARQMFERHGLTYHARPGATQEPASKIRRVEKNIRMRVRWICHSCSTTFSAEKRCPGCGHRRCFQCDRIPRRSVRRPVREDMNLELAPETQEEASRSEEQLQTHFGLVQPSALQRHVDQRPSHGAEASPWRCTIQIGQPRPHTTTVFEDSTSTPAHKRDCHQCESTTERIDQTDCTACGHQYCILCPLYTNNSIHNMHIKQSAPIVERVYRKPRQRVRFRCEHCDTQYTDRSCCASCGHERCDNCPRFPPRKHTAAHDPSAWQALEAKITNRLNPGPSTPVDNETPLQEESQHQARL